MRIDRTLPEQAIGFHIEAAPNKGIKANYNRLTPRRTRCVALSACISIMPDGTRRDMTPERKPRSRVTTYTRPDGLLVERGNTVTLAEIVQADMQDRKDRIAVHVGNITPTAEMR